MRKEYDFSKAEQGKFYRPLEKLEIPIYLDNELKKEKVLSLYHKIGYEWKIVGYGLFRPIVIIPLTVTVFCLYFANKSNIDRAFSLVLQIIAIVSLAIASGFFADAMKNILGNNLVVNKGKSALRNLSLVRVKTKNIFNREKVGTSKEEVMNLLSLLEKDIINAIQDWRDILPYEVCGVEEIYKLLEENENQLEIKEGEIKQLSEQLSEQKQLGEKEKEELRKEIRDKGRERLKLSQQIGKLQFIGTTSTAMGLSSGDFFSSASDNINVCSKCGREYRSSRYSSESSLFCPECSSSIGVLK